MKDWLHEKLKAMENWIDHNRGLFAGLLMTAIVAVWLAGCASTTIGPVSGQKVEREQFYVEVRAAESALRLEQTQLEARVAEHNEKVAALAATAEAGEADLTRQDAIKTQLLELGGALATAAVGGTITPAAIINGILTAGALLIGGGVVYDNRRKDGVITSLKLTATQPPETVKT